MAIEEHLERLRIAVLHQRHQVLVGERQEVCARLAEASWRSKHGAEVTFNRAEAHLHVRLPTKIGATRITVGALRHARGAG